MTKETIIIDAGRGGLASAILLAWAGIKVKTLARLKKPDRLAIREHAGQIEHQRLSQ